ncbi:unnamed protein product [Schistosoma haematobium]|nr:unnamed protein product [Schistosoma haematobium]
MTRTEGQSERALTAVKDTLDDIKSRPHRQQVIIGTCRLYIRENRQGCCSSFGWKSDCLTMRRPTRRYTYQLEKSRTCWSPNTVKHTCHLRRQAYVEK